MAIRLPIDWDGVIPDEEVPFDEWVVVGTIPAEIAIAFDPSVEEAPFTLVVDKFTDIDSGLNLETSFISLNACGNGVFVMNNLIRVGGAYFRVHPSTDANDYVEGILTAEAAQDAEDIREAIGLSSPDLTSRLTTLQNTAAAGNVSATSVRAAIGMSTSNLDTQLSNILNAGINEASIRSALGMSSANLDQQLNNILTGTTEGSGDVAFTWLEYEDGHAGDPAYAVPDVTVHVFNNAEADGIPVATSVTDELGRAVFYVDQGTYYVFRRKAGRTFVNPTEVAVS